MSKVQIDDFECPYCGRITMAELDLKTKKYTCLRCLNGKRKQHSSPFKLTKSTPFV